MQLKHARTLPALLLLLAAGCGFKTSGNGVADAPGTGLTDGAPDSGSRAPDASIPTPDASTGNGLTMPVIDSLTGNPMTLVHGGTTITATAHDSQTGVAITSVKLTDTATGVVYGAFTANGDGSFSFILTWSAIEAAAPINIAANASVPRVVTATFVDANQNPASGMLTLTLECPANQTAQNGTCADLDGDIDNCGAVGNKCTSSQVCEATFDIGCACIAGECTSAIPAIVTKATTCDSVCAGHGATCAASTCDGLPMGGAVEVSLTKLSPMACSDPSPTKPTALQTIDCCCVQ